MLELWETQSTLSLPLISMVLFMGQLELFDISIVLFFHLAGLKFSIVSRLFDLILKPWGYLGFLF